jgi:hypothetical protein
MAPAEAIEAGTGDFSEQYDDSTKVLKYEHDFQTNLNLFFSPDLLLFTQSKLLWVLKKP